MSTNDLQQNKLELCEALSVWEDFSFPSFIDD